VTAGGVSSGTMPAEMSPTTRRWLERLAFSFILIAIVLVWECYKSLTGRSPAIGTGRLTIYMVGAACSFAMGILGIRSRHRPPE
jgi:hypothetical protein